MLSQTNSVKALKANSKPQKYLEHAGWFLRPDCAARSECPQFGMPAERRAQFRVPNVPISQISERALFRIYEHAQCREFSNIPFCSVPMSYLAANGVVCCATGTPQRVGDCSEQAVLVAGA